MVAVLHPIERDADPPLWRLVNASDTGQSRLVSPVRSWEAMPGFELLAPATEMVEAMLERVP